MLLGVLCVAPIVIAATSPLLAARSVSYILGGLAGVVALSLLLIQPILAAGYLPGPPAATLRRWHHWGGAAMVVAVAIHVGGLLVASPPDALDALLLVSPTPFSVYGVLAMWAVVLTVVLVGLRATLRIRRGTWAILHNALALVIVFGTVLHALMIDGTMGRGSKIILCTAVIVVTLSAIVHLRVMRGRRRR